MTLCCEDPELWFTDTETAVARAKAICNRCPKLASCRAHALNTRERHGVWGGLTEAERDALLHPGKPRKRKLAPPGTEASGVRGVFWHATKDRWVVVIRHRGRMHWAGQFVDQGAAEAAAIAKYAELDTSPRRWSSRTA